MNRIYDNIWINLNLDDNDKNIINLGLLLSGIVIGYISFFLLYTIIHIHSIEVGQSEIECVIVSIFSEYA